VKSSVPRPLHQVIRELLLRLILSLLLLSLVAMGLIGYTLEQHLESHQQLHARSFAHTVDAYLEHADRVLGAMAWVAEANPPDEVASYLQTAREAYDYFDTLYYLDAEGRVVALAPLDPRYRGVDMSGQPYFQWFGEGEEVRISSPFTSLRTGQPTVYMGRRLADGELLVAELSLAALQESIVARLDPVEHEMLFVTDRFGTLLAHPRATLVAQQLNVGDLPIVRRGLDGEGTMLYRDEGTLWLASAVPIERTGWLVVAQIPFLLVYFPYLKLMGGLFLLLLLVVWVPVRHLQGTLNRRVVEPLTWLRESADALADGDFARLEALESTPVAFAEIDALLTDFRRMSQAIRARETALRESEVKYRSLIEQSEDAIYLLYKNRFELINPKFEALFGVTPEEVQAPDFDFRSLVAPESLPLIEARMQKMAAGAKLSPRYEFTALHKDGRRIEVEVSVSYVPYRGGTATQGVLRDITARKQMEAERERLLAQIQQQAREVQQIIDTVPEGVLLLNADRRVVLTNPAAKEALAVLTDVGPEAQLVRLGDRALEDLLTSPPTKGLWHEVQSDSRIFEVIARSMYNGAEAENWVLVLRDVTRERQVQQRVHQQERLAAIGQLAAGIAHDFNNILATIVLYAQMLARTPGLAPRSREQLAIIDDQAQQATDLIQQILDFSRRAVIERKPVDLGALLVEQVRLLERTLPASINVELHGEGDEYLVNGDPTRLRQVVTNLALNARDAMPEGGILRIELAHLEVEPGRTSPLAELEPGLWVELTVSDNGVGISETVRQHLFEPFFTTKAPGEGSGLGLAQVHGIVRQHEGHIEVSSRPGEGTTFAVYLPALREAPGSSFSVEGGVLFPGRGETVLVVEDNTDTRQALIAGLKSLGYRTVEAANGEEALEILEGLRVAVVLSDMVMPKMGGKALVRALRERGVKTPVVLLTGHPLAEEAEALQTPEVCEQLSKPVHLSHLAEAIRRALER